MWNEFVISDFLISCKCKLFFGKMQKFEVLKSIKDILCKNNQTRITPAASL